MVHCQSVSHCPSLSQFVLLAILAYFHFSQSVPFVQGGQREGATKWVPKAKETRDTLCDFGELFRKLTNYARKWHD